MYFEKTDKPWFGPRKRAKDMLSKTRSIVVEPKLAIDSILKSLDLLEKEVNHLKFYDFIRKEDKYRYTIVIIQTISNPITRDKVYYNAMKCVESTGWYPLVQGERLDSVNSKNILINESLNLPINLNNILGFESACKDGDGTSIRLLFENGSILFDSAFPNKLVLKDSDKIVFLSHSHADHTGGIINLLSTNLIIIINKETYSILCSKNILDENLNYPNLYIIGSDSKIFFDSYMIKSFPVPHCFGSIGYKGDFNSIEILFTGDIVIKTNRFDYSNYLSDLFKRKDSKKFIFLDSTMCMRNDGASQLNSARELLNKIDKIDDNVVVITSRDSEQLIYALMDLFFYIKNNNRNQYSFILPREVKKTASVIHENFIKSNYNELDRILYSQYGNSKSAWGESRWVYWIKYEDEIESIAKNSKSIIFLTHNDLDLFPTVSKYRYLTIGKTDDYTISKFNAANLDIDTTPWTMHSSKSILTDSITNFHKKGIQTIIFHDYSKRMSKYTEQFTFEVKILNTNFTSFNNCL